MDSLPIVNVAIFALGALFLLLAIIYAFRALFGRSDADLMYAVGRQQAKNEAIRRWFQALVLLVLGAGILAVWYLFGGFSPDQVVESETQTFPTPDTQQVQIDPPATAIPEPTAIPPTATPEPATEAPTTEPPTPVVETLSEQEPAAETEPETETQPETSEVQTETVEFVEPTLQPTPAPTEIPYDAFVNVVGGLNLRDAPNGNVVVLIDNGGGVFLLDGAEFDGTYNWREIQTLAGEIGWVADEFLLLPGESP